MAFADQVIRSFTITGLIAAGGQGRVYDAQLDDTGETIAVKVLTLDIDVDVRSGQVMKLRNQLDNIMAVLNHENLVRHFHHQYSPMTGPARTPEYHIFMERYPGKTLSKIARTTVVTPSLLQKWVKQIVNGVAFLHEHSYLHRDITGVNIMLSSPDIHEGVIKIVDLGLVKQILRDTTNPGEITAGVGSYAYKSPEMITGPDLDAKPPIILGKPTDIWSLGCVVIELVTGGMPEFSKQIAPGKTVKLDGHDREAQITWFVGNGGFPTVPGNLPGPVDDFIQKCLTRYPNDRPTAEDLKKHNMLTASAEEVSGWVLPQRNLLPAAACQDN